MKNNHNRRLFLRQISIAALSGAGAVSLPVSSLARQIRSHAADPEKGHIFLTAPYLQAPGPNSVTIMWITNYLCNSWVEYGETEQLGLKAHQSAHGLVNSYNRINSIKLDGLKPGTTYHYRVCSRLFTDFEPYKIVYGDTISSSVFHFKTQGVADQQVSWLILNDIHDHPESFGELIKLNGAKPYDFVFLNGDMFDYQEDEQQFIDHLLRPCSLFSSNVPFMLVRGNHETRGKFARNIYPYYTNYNNGQYFTFERGPVFGIVLDTGEDKEDTHPEYGGICDFDAYRIEQAGWLKAQMKTRAFRKAKFRVVMMHIPPYHSDGRYGSEHCRSVFGPLFNKYKIDLLICGHTHVYGVHHPDPPNYNYPIIIGGGPARGKRTLIQINVKDDTLNLVMLRDDGQEVGKYTLHSKV